MALIQCPECHKEISNHALNCPACGFPLQSTNLHSGAKKRSQAQFLASVVGFGSHNFYLGFYLRAIIQLLLTSVGLPLLLIGGILTFWFPLGGLSLLGVGILMVLGVLIWQLIEWHRIKTQSIKKDAKGQPLV